MLPKLFAFWERVRTSLWFLPGLMMAGAVLLSWLAFRIDIQVDATGFVWWLNQGSAEEAGRLLSALLGSLITMATLVISITMVVLTLAAGQLGPRLIRNFVGDRRTQLVIGLFIGTIVYILLIFRLLDSDLANDAVPHFAVTLASGLVLCCLLALIFYVHHLSRSIVADTMVNRVGEELDRAIRSNLRDAKDDVPTLVAHRSGAPARTGFQSSGYVQAIDYAGLAAAAAEHDALIEVLVRPGHHVLAGRTHAHVWPAAALDDGLSQAIGEAVAIGRDRTAFQDIEFSVRQLVEIAVRALSPGINDPFTAIAVVDRLAAALASAMQRGEAQSIWNDDDGQARIVLAAASSFDGLADLAFNQIRQAAAGHADVLISLMDALAALAETPRTETQRGGAAAPYGGDHGNRAEFHQAHGRPRHA